MKKSIWKFPIASPEQTTIKMPGGAEILTIQTQNGMPCIWALVNPENDTEERCFEIFGTGHDVPVDMGIERKYINTFQLNGGGLVYHLFERILLGKVQLSKMS